MALNPDQTLFVVARKRFVPIYSGEGKARELILLVGHKEISFDEPELFPWAEALIQQESFSAGSATAWTPEPLEWPRVQGLLEALVGEGILSRLAPLKIANVALSTQHLAFLREEEARPAAAGPRSWNPDPGAVLRELSIGELPLGYVETLMSVHRLAHIAVDREGRQVGESNAFPDFLRLKLQTDWKPCNYAGSRFGLELPMNMTALRSMLAHWKPVLRATLAVREELLRRYPPRPDGRWKLGEVLFCASGILALPALQVMRFRDPVKTGELDPVLSSLFRVTDGVRMVASHMLDLYEWGMTHETPVTGKDLTDAAEKEGQYRSRHGVCAGPQAMIDELLDTMLNGRPVEGAPAPGSWAADIPLAIDYGLRGVQLHAAMNTVWDRMAAAYERIREALSGTPGPLRDEIERDWLELKPGRRDVPAQREFAEAYYRRAFNNAQTGIRGISSKVDLAAELTHPKDLPGGGALRDLFATVGAPAAVADHLLDYLGFERNALRVITSVQREINSLLGRPQPLAPLTGSQLAIGLSLRTPAGRSGPYLPETIFKTLGIRVENQADATRFSIQSERR
jgi:hypothetical protein